MTKFFKILIYTILFLVIGLIGMVIFSPYGNKEGFNERLIIQTVEIDAPVEKVYDYLGNSDNAKDWSVFVDHISVLNSNLYNDGDKGSIRRCFKEKDTNGIYWDEEILIDEPNKRRRLSIYNMHGFSLSGKGLLTEQLYVKKGDNKCEVSLTLFLIDEQSNLIKELKLYFAGFKVARIFKGNLNRVKELVE